MITQRDLDLIQDDRAFSPDPIRIEAGWASWLAGIGFIVMLAVLVLGA